MGKRLILLEPITLATGLLVAILERAAFVAGLPGDLRLRIGGLSIAFPVLTCLIASLTLSISLSLVLRR